MDDCALPALAYNDSPLDIALLWVFRRLVQDYTGYKSDIPGIKGLLAEVSSHVQ